MNEILDIFDSKMNFIGNATREEVHQKGYWHQTFHCWILRSDGEHNYVLFQIRDKSKDVAPKKLDITAAGHLKSGERKEDGVRELKEELGLDIDVNQLVYLGIRLTASENKNQINKEFAHVYMLRNDKPINEYKFDDGEVEGLVQVEIMDGLKLCSREVESVRCKVARKNSGNVCVDNAEIYFEHFIPRIDAYYYKIFIMAQRYFNGEHYLSI